MMMDESIFQHYSKSAAAQDNNAFLVNPDAAALLRESPFSHRYVFSRLFTCGLSKPSKARFQRRAIDELSALKQQVAEQDHKKRDLLAGR
jgi:hypothetical protein